MRQLADWPPAFTSRPRRIRYYSTPYWRDSIVIVDPQPPATYGQDDIEGVLNELINGGKYPEPDEPGGRNLYIVFMPPGTTGPGGNSGAHGYFNSGSVIDVDNVGTDTVEYGSLNTMTRTFGHEVVEACSDPEFRRLVRR